MAQSSSPCANEHQRSLPLDPGARLQSKKWVVKSAGNVVRRLILAVRLDAFAAVLSAKGYAPSSGQTQLLLISDLSHWLSERGLPAARLDEQQIQNFLRRPRRYAGRGSRSTLLRFLEYLRARGAVQSQKVERADEKPSVRLEADFRGYLVEQRGLTKSTVTCYAGELRLFLKWRFPRGEAVSSDIRPADVTNFISERAQAVCPKRAKLAVAALRSFCRFLRLRGDIRRDLAASVLTVPNWKLSILPRFISANEVKRLLGACDTSTSTGLRDRAILLVLARLGLRASEVVQMTLDDFDWDAAELMVRGKGGRQDRLPLPDDVGRAITAYLQKARPRCSTRRLFVRRRAPIQGFARPAAVSTIVARTFARADLHPPHRGAHVDRKSVV